MKHGKKILAIAMIALMLLSLSACGFGDIPVIKAMVGFCQHSSFHAEPELEAGLKINIPAYGVNMDLAVTADGSLDYCADPLCFTADVQLNAMDEDLRLLAYGEDVEGEFVIWYSMDGGATWEQTTLGKTEEINSGMDAVSSLDLSDLIEAGKTFGDALSGFTKSGTERVNGTAANRYDAVFRISAIADSEAAKEAFLDGVAESLETDAASLEGLIDPSEIGDVQLSLWLEEKSNELVKVQIDLTETLRSLLESELMQNLLASEAGLGDTAYSAEVGTVRLAVTFSDFDSIESITRPSGIEAAEGAAAGIIGGADGPTEIFVAEDSLLREGSTWHGSCEIRNHAGKGELENGSTEIWGLLGSSGGELFFELYTEPDFSGSAKPILSYWAEVDGNRIVPVIGEEDAWFLNIYLAESDRDAMTFTLADGELSAQYFYYDASAQEACDVVFTLAPNE